MTAIGCIEGLAVISTKLNDEVKSAVAQWANAVLDESREQYCPIDTGLLKSSGLLSEQTNTPTSYVLRLSYSTEYAAAVHEKSSRHSHGSRKYLTTPFNQNSNKLIHMIESAGEKVL